MSHKFVAVVLTLIAILFALSISPHAQQVKKTPMVGYLTLANNQRENEQTLSLPVGE